MNTTEGTIEEIRRLIEQVEGWLTDREGALLYNLARRCTGRGAIIEIGSWKGKSTIWLAKGSEQGQRINIFAVDPHIGFPDVPESYGKIWTFDEFNQNITSAGVKYLITPVLKTSEEAAREINQPVELIFIDGVHEYDYVKSDLEWWFPKVTEGGIMAFHDTTGNLGAKRVVEEFVYRSRYFRNIGFVDSITYAEKVARNSLGDRLRNRYILLLKQLYELATQLHLPGSIRKIGKRLLGIK